MLTRKEWEINFLRDLLKSFTALEESVSIVVQGPLNERILRAAPHYLDLIKKQKYKDYGNLVVSYWEGDEESIIEKLKGEEGVVLVKNKKNKVPRNRARRGSRGANPWILQNYTTLEGIKRATGHNTIKVRSDEIYPGIETFSNRTLKALNGGSGVKFVTSDIFFRRDDHEKFHPSDHIIAGRTNKMLRGFESAVRKCASTSSRKYKFPEQLICQALLSANGVWPIEYKSKKIMQQNFRIIPIEELRGAIWTCSNRKYDELRNPETGWVKDIRDI
jgi:hypothetical protein